MLYLARQPFLIFFRVILNLEVYAVDTDNGVVLLDRRKDSAELVHKHLEPFSVSHHHAALSNADTILPRGRPLHVLSIPNA